MPRTDALLRAPATESFFRQFRTAVSDIVARRHERAMLARLDVHLLRDIGIDPAAAARECAKPFWRH